MITEIAHRTSLKRDQADEAVSTMLDIICETLAAGEKVQITGFGTFEVRERGERNGRNPYSGESIVIPASRYPAFVPGKVFRAKIKGNNDTDNNNNNE